MTSNKKNNNINKKQHSTKKKANELSGSEWTKYSISIWSDIKKTTEEKKLNHPAMFPEMLVQRLIKCFTTNDDIYILDPFMGSGSTIVAAFHMGKCGIGFEINNDYIKIAEQRLQQSNLFNNPTYKIYCKDARLIREYIEPSSVHLCVTSPPYWDIMSQKRTADYKEIRDYGNEKENIAKIRNYNEFLEKLIEIFKGVFDVLIPGKYCIVNVMDLRKGSKFYPFHSDLANKMIEIGFIFDDIIIWDRRSEYNNLRSLGYPYVFRINKVHEYLLIFRKPLKK